MDRRESLKHILEAYRCNPTPRQLGAAIKGIEELFADCETQTIPLEERKREFHEQCTTLLLEDRSNAQELTAFYKYWTEHPEKVKSNTKMRFEKQPTFNIKGRYATWRKQQKRFAIVNMLKR